MTAAKLEPRVPSNSFPRSSAGQSQVGHVPTGHRGLPAGVLLRFIAANSFKTTLPNVNPFISVGIGTAVSIILAMTGVVHFVQSTPESLIQ